MKLRMNRLLFLAALGGAAYFVYNETKKNPELVTSAKEQWKNVKDGANRMATEVRNEADDFLQSMDLSDDLDSVEDAAQEVKHTVEDIAQDAKHGVEDAAKDVKQGAEDLAQEAKEVVEGIKDDL